MESVFVHVGSNVRKMMKAKGITVSSAARYLEMSPSGVYDIFKRKQIIDEYLLGRIAQLLSVSEAALLSGSGRQAEAAGERDSSELQASFDYERIVLDLRKEVEFLRQQIMQKDVLLDRLLRKLVD
ncbi:MAG: helix-turn-helix transcriptional regulator [Siphonobacter aquaeclarae]|nr:helix-turn-helix transcriptional regulator [Siphonobacter aquaeclarae]